MRITSVMRTTSFFDVSETRSKPTTVFDSFANPAAGGGLRQDKVYNTGFMARTYLPYDYLSWMYSRDGLITNIIDYAADDMTRTWGYIDGEPTIGKKKRGKISTEMTRLHAPAVFNQAKKWARLHGGALIYAIIQDGGRPEDPVNFDKISDIESLRIVELPDVLLGSSQWDDDPNSPNYGNVKIYHIRTRIHDRVYENDVHYTRCCPIKGLSAPISCRAATPLIEQRTFGVSIVDGIYEYIRDFATAHKNVSNVLEELVIGKMKVSDLDEILGAPDGKKRLKNRLDGISQSRSTINAVLYGTDEEYTRDSITVSGVSDLLDRFQMNLCAVTKYPVTKLFGRSSAGMNATGENEKSTYYDNLQSERMLLSDSIQWLVNLIGKWLKVKDFTPFVWNQLFQLDDKTRAELAQKRAEAFRTRMNGYQIAALVGAVDADEVRTINFPNLPERMIEPDIPDPTLPSGGNNGPENNAANADPKSQNSTDPRGEEGE